MTAGAKNNSCAKICQALCHIPVNTTHLPNVRPMLGQRRRRWANISQTLGGWVVFAGILTVIKSRTYWYNMTALTWLQIDFTSITMRSLCVAVVSRSHSWPFDDEIEKSASWCDEMSRVITHIIRIKSFCISTLSARRPSLSVYVRFWRKRRSPRWKN